MKKRSVVWKFFRVLDSDDSKAECRFCGVMISRGSEKKLYNTSSLLNHLKFKHPDHFSLIKKGERPKSGDEEEGGLIFPAFSHARSTQFNIMEKTKMWSSDSAETSIINEAVCKMICVDMHPISVVGDAGFRNLVAILEPRYEMPSNKIFAEKILPEMYSNVCQSLKNLLQRANSISFTINTWTSHCNTQSFMGLTAHWVDENFDRKFAVLHCENVTGRHTSEILTNIICNMIDGWEISKEKIHIFVRDNTSKIEEVMREADLQSVGCFSNTLQFCIRDLLFSHKSVCDLLTVTREIVSHFKHSTCSAIRLRKIQIELNLPANDLIHDVASSWNSSFYMFRRLLEQKHGVIQYVDEENMNKIPTLLTSSQWQLMLTIVNILQPFEELTQDLLNEMASISLIIPACRAIVYFLTNQNMSDGPKELVRELLKSVQKQFKEFEQNPIYIVSTFLDPRFKLKCFASEVEATHAKQYVLEVVEKLGLQTAEIKIEDKDEIKQPVMNAGLWSLWDSMNETTTSNFSLMPFDHEFNMYNSESCIHRSCDPILWWKANCSRLPLLSAVAQIYMATPPTSVASERLFNIANQSILPDQAEQLIFLKWNMDLCNTEHFLQHF